MAKLRSADERLDDLPIEALECRAIGHAWPRSSSKRTVLKPSAYAPNGRVAEVVREMQCEGGCGVTRIETFIILADGRMYRQGGLKYRVAEGTTYYLKPSEDGAPQQRVERDHVRFAALIRRYPTLKW